MLKNKEKTAIRQKAEDILSQKLHNATQNTTDENKDLIHELQVHQIELQMQNEELQLAHIELEKSKQRYLNLYDKAPVGYLELDNSFIIQEVNDTALKLLDVRYKDIINNNISKYIFKDDQDIFYIYRKKFKVLNEQHSCELRMLKNHGKPFWALLEASLDEDTLLNGVLRLVISDISDRKKQESELKIKDEILLVQSRQAAMGEMIAMIAHQWRQPITTIGMISNNIKVDLELGEEIQSQKLENYCNDVQVQVKYLSQTIDDFKNFLQTDLPRESISVCETMNTTLNMIRKSLENNNIQIQTEFNCNNNLNVIKSELNQVFINIITNAKDALLENNIQNPIISIKIYENKEYVNIDIADNAHGIPKKILAKLGEPYTSSKSQNATGLGIYISKIIIEKHMDGILKWKNLDEGACFTIMIRKKST